MNLFDTPREDNKKVSKTIGFRFKVGDLVQIDSTIGFIVDRGEDGYVFGFYGHITAIENGYVTVHACGHYMYWLRQAQPPTYNFFYDVRVLCESVVECYYPSEAPSEASQSEIGGKVNN